MAESTALADFLRARRAGCIRPTSACPTSGRRRTPGLRREEVAALAGVSIDYLVRLEQGRDVNPSMEVLDALATALRLSGDEREHLLGMSLCQKAKAMPSNQGKELPSWSVPQAAVHAPLSRNEHARDLRERAFFYDSMPGLSNLGQFCTSLVMRIARMVDPMQSVYGPTAPFGRYVQRECHPEFHVAQ